MRRLRKRIKPEVPGLPGDDAIDSHGPTANVLKAMQFDGEQAIRCMVGEMAMALLAIQAMS